MTENTRTVSFTPTVVSEAQHKISVGMDEAESARPKVVDELDRLFGDKPLPNNRSQEYTMSAEAAIWLAEEMDNAADIAHTWAELARDFDKRQMKTYLRNAAAYENAARMLKGELR